MERLRQVDLRALLGCLGDVYAIPDLETFPGRAISALPRIVPSDHTSFNEVNPRRRRITWVFDPPDGLDHLPEARRIFEQHMPEHPLIMRYHRTRDGQALKISDFLSLGQFRGLGLYEEFYRQLDTEHQVAFTLPAPPPLIIGIALNRGRRDFSERDRLLLNLVRPHLSQAYGNADAMTQGKQQLALLRQGVEAIGGGLMILTHDGRMTAATAQARQWLAEYFGHPSRPTAHLPEDLWRWVRVQEAMLASRDDVPPPRKPLVLEREGKRLVVRLFSGPGQSLLLLAEQETAPQPAALERFGVTRREAEVLAWVVQGKTNVEIGMILGARPRTVAKHLERIYQKLGVENRTAAAALALTSAPAA